MLKNFITCKNYFLNKFNYFNIHNFKTQSGSYVFKAECLLKHFIVQGVSAVRMKNYRQREESMFGQKMKLVIVSSQWRPQMNLHRILALVWSLTALPCRAKEPSFYMPVPSIGFTCLWKEGMTWVRHLFSAKDSLGESWPFIYVSQQFREMSLHFENSLGSHQSILNIILHLSCSMVPHSAKCLMCNFILSLRHL